MAVPTLAPGGSRPQAKTKKKPDPWMGAARGTSMGAGSTSALKALQAAGQTAPASAAAVPKVDSVTALPPDSIYENQVGTNRKTYEQRVNAIKGQRTGTLLDYGYGAEFDPVTHDMVAGSLKLDPNNPYSKAAQLQRSYDNAKRGTTNSLAERGLGTSGALVNAQNSNDTGFSTSKDTLEKNLGAILAGLAGQETQAGIDREGGDNVAWGERIGRAPSNPLSTAGTLPATPAAAPPAAPAVPTLAPGGSKPQYSVQPGKNSRGQAGVWHIYPGGRRVFLVGAKS